MTFSNEDKQNLITEIKSTQKMLDTLIKDVTDISEDPYSLEFGPSNIQIERIEKEIYFLKNVLKEFHEQATDTESSFSE
jgi:hypothetical protein